MKLNILTTAALLAITGALMTQSAKAQFTGVSGDLILSFSASSGTGSTTNYEIDLGQFTSYTGTSEIDIANIATDLSSVYGSGWATDTNLSFGIAGVVNNGALGGVKNNSLLVSNPSNTTAYTAEAASSLGGQIAAAATLYVPAGDLSNPPVAGSTANSYKVKTANSNSFANVTPNDGFAASTAPIGSSVFLDTLQPGSKSSTAGTSTLNPDGFSISSSGEVIYAAAVAAPEPSTYVSVLAGLLFLVLLKRRQSVVSL